MNKSREYVVGKFIKKKSIFKLKAFRAYKHAMHGL